MIPRMFGNIVCLKKQNKRNCQFWQISRSKCRYHTNIWRSYIQLRQRAFIKVNTINQIEKCCGQNESEVIINSFL